MKISRRQVLNRRFLIWRGLLVLLEETRTKRIPDMTAKRFAPALVGNYVVVLGGCTEISIVLSTPEQVNVGELNPQRILLDQSMNP